MVMYSNGARPLGAPVRGDDSGQALPLVVGVVAVLALLLAGLAWYAESLTDAARARTAADAAALAGVIEGETAAAALAAANHGTLVGFARIGADVIVTVRVGRATVQARATANRDSFSTLMGWPRSTARATPPIPNSQPPQNGCAVRAWQRRTQRTPDLIGCRMGTPSTGPGPSNGAQSTATAIMPSNRSQMPRTSRCCTTATAR